ncbi:MAG: nuclear transport factor 2 family protein [Actinomycetota bacterium]
MRARAKPITALALAATALALAGCGPFGGESEEDKAGDAVTELIDARNDGDFARVCELLAKPVVDGIEGTSGKSCDEALGSLAEGQRSQTVRIDEVRVEGDRATVDATVGPTGQAGVPQNILLIKEEGDWKVATANF